MIESNICGAIAISIGMPTLPPEKTANLTEAKAVALAVANPSLIRRPLIEHKDGSVTVGFSKKIQDLLA